jgi:3-oxoadipate enol-lactonase/4-carboxymuconolactone decarboxylase
MNREPVLASVRLNGHSRPDLPLLLVGPSLGTSATTLWSRAASLLSEDLDVVGWDLPGHGVSPPTERGFEVADLASAVLDVADSAQADRGDSGAAFFYAGDSLGGAVGLQLLLDAAPDRVAAAVLLCTGAKIGAPDDWRDRAETVRTSGIQPMVDTAPARWFGPGFVDRDHVAAAALLAALRATDPESYALACEALAGFDVRARLAEITAPVVAVAGSHDEVTPVHLLEAVARTVPNGTLMVLESVAHLAPVEAPEPVAWLIRDHVAASSASRDPDVVGPRAGMAVRRAVLGDAHVDHATSGATAFSRDFQEFITQYAWGGVWTRPGLDRRTRSMITLTALVAGGHHDELAMHVRAARTNGVTEDEIKEVLIHTAIYVGVPAANSAFTIAQQVLDEIRDPADDR